MAAPDHDDDSQPRGEPPVRLAALYRGEAWNASLHVPVGDGFVAVDELAAHIYAGITLEPGDVIATGTPSGVAAGMTPPAYLAPGDKVSIGIAGIGELVNTVAEPQ
jgi:2-keto-4-pentenoate hydratase/2-oxohepta-3-ene-1,7-dioic acid hydratase in catechol pathway